MNNFISEIKASVEKDIDKENKRSYINQKKLEILTVLTLMQLFLLIPNSKEERTLFKRNMDIYFSEFENERELLLFFKEMLMQISKFEDIEYLNNILKNISILDERVFESGKRVVSEHMNAWCMKNLKSCMFIPEQYHLLSSEKIKKYEIDLRSYFENKK